MDIIIPVNENMVYNTGGGERGGRDAEDFLGAMPNPITGGVKDRGTKGGMEENAFQEM